MSSEKYKYEIGGLCVEMTAKQAERWNSGSTTNHDLRTIMVHDTGSDANDRSGRYVTLRRATNERLEPTLAKMLDGSSANLTG